MPDEIDKKILEILIADSRTPNVKIASSVGLTEGAVRRRILNLIKTGVIKSFSIDVQSGIFFGLVMVKARGETKTMMSEISSLAIHTDAYEIAGEFDGCIIISGNSMEALDAKIESIRKIKSVADTKTYISLKRW